jgi:hypothetical protein
MEKIKKYEEHKLVIYYFVHKYTIAMGVPKTSRVVRCMED